MKFLSAMLLAGLAAGPAMAQSVGGRPYTPRMSCAAAHALVARSGAIVLGTGPDLYDRYVSGGGSCSIDLVAKPAFVPSADNPQCMVGYTCEKPEWNDE